MSAKIRKAAPQAGKAIFLFSDGTGNSSGKLFKTNVWRLYEALDLRPVTGKQRLQVAYYDNGVGTSAFRPLRLLGGVFGIGLKRNVQRLYRFLSDNYEDGDAIYLFGFSRGAFTIRLLAGLIARQGIIARDGSAAVAPYQIRAAWREYCRDRWPNRLPAKLFAVALRWIRDLAVSLVNLLAQRTPWRRTRRHFPDIDFVGVWDTVAAYGGPFAELTRGIDDWVWPLTMPNYRLHPKVRQARHALSLDDERDAFHPLLWDEFLEADLIANGMKVVVGQRPDCSLIERQLHPLPRRLRQVWFAGVHSDVGGGYPDESLSYIPLLWMMRELPKDIRFLDHFEERAESLANPFGPVHDSRAGLLAYYRYQPRKIAALLHPPSVRTRALRDPEIDRCGGEHGLLLNVSVHDSVIARIVEGTDSYAPAALPARFDLVSTAGSQATHAAARALWSRNRAIAGKVRRRFAEQENCWDLSWRRRLVYFATIAATLALVTLPLHGLFGFIDEYCSDDRCFAQQAVERVTPLLGESVQSVLRYYTAKPLALIVLLIFIGGLILWGKRLERRFRAGVRATWTSFLGDGWSGRFRRSGVRRFREHAVYQWSLFLGKWVIAPAALGLASLAVLAWAIGVTATQTFYALFEPSEVYCQNRSEARPVDPSNIVRFNLTSSCTDLQADVTRGRRYVLELTVRDDWRDGDPGSRWSFAADPVNGVNEPLSGPIRWAGAYKRVTGANWLEPLTEVRTHDPPHWAKRLLSYVVGPDIEIRTTSFSPIGGKRYLATVCPRQSGHLYFTVNDAAPFGAPWFYDNNQGSANLRIIEQGTCTPPQ